MEDSDVDIIVVSDDCAKMELSERLQYLQRAWKSRIPLEAFGYTESEFRNVSKRSTYVKDAIRNGMTLLRQGHKKSVLDLAGVLFRKEAAELRFNIQHMRSRGRARLHSTN